MYSVVVIKIVLNLYHRYFSTKILLFLHVYVNVNNRDPFKETQETGTYLNGGIIVRKVNSLTEEGAGMWLYEGSCRVLRRRDL